MEDKKIQELFIKLPQSIMVLKEYRCFECKVVHKKRIPLFLTIKVNEFDISKTERAKFFKVYYDCGSPTNTTFIGEISGMGYPSMIIAIENCIRFVERFKENQNTEKCAV